MMLLVDSGCEWKPVCQEEVGAFYIVISSLREQDP